MTLLVVRVDPQWVEVSRDLNQVAVQEGVEARYVGLCGIDQFSVEARRTGRRLWQRVKTATVALEVHALVGKVHARRHARGIRDFLLQCLQLGD